MPSVATWWCGQPAEREYVIEHLDELVIKPTFPSRARGAGVRRGALRRASGPRWSSGSARTPHALRGAGAGGALDGADRRRRRARAAPPRAARLRGASGDGYVVMPGGLTRVSPSPDSLVVSMQRGGGSKDTWVLADGPVPLITLLDRVARPIDVSRAAASSRAASPTTCSGSAARRARRGGARLFRCALRRLAEEPIRAATRRCPTRVALLERSSGRAHAGRRTTRRGAGATRASRRACSTALFDRARPSAGRRGRRAAPARVAAARPDLARHLARARGPRAGLRRARRPIRRCASPTRSSCSTARSRGSPRSPASRWRA